MAVKAGFMQTHHLPDDLNANFILLQPHLLVRMATLRHILPHHTVIILLLPLPLSIGLHCIAFKRVREVAFLIRVHPQCKPFDYCSWPTLFIFDYLLRHNPYLFSC
jgi:hypothetical protein